MRVVQSDDLALQQHIDGVQDPLLAIIDEQLRTELKMRVRRLLNDLASDDLPMALLNLAQLHRAMAARTPENIARARATSAHAMFECGAEDEEDGRYLEEDPWGEGWAWPAQ